MNTSENQTENNNGMENVNETANTSQENVASNETVDTNATEVPAEKSMGDKIIDFLLYSGDFEAIDDIQRALPEYTEQEIMTECAALFAADKVVTGAWAPMNVFGVLSDALSNEYGTTVTTYAQSQAPAAQVATTTDVAVVNDDAEEAEMISPWEDIAKKLKEMEATGNYRVRVIDFTPKTGVNSLETALRNQVRISKIHTFSNMEEDSAEEPTVIATALRVDILLVRKDNRSTINYKIELAEQLWNMLNQDFTTPSLQDQPTKTASELRVSDNLNEVMIGYFGEGFRDEQ